MNLEIVQRQLQIAHFGGDDILPVVLRVWELKIEAIGDKEQWEIT